MFCLNPKTLPTLATISPSFVLISAKEPEGAGGLTASDSAYTQGCPDLRVLKRSLAKTRWTGAVLPASSGICWHELPLLLLSPLLLLLQLPSLVLGLSLQSVGLRPT